jgi:hypothetical protein
VQDSLSGNSCTHLLACLHPKPSNLRECLSTLQFATRCTTVHTSPVINTVGGAGGSGGGGGGGGGRAGGGNSRLVETLQKDLAALQQELDDTHAYYQQLLERTRPSTELGLVEKAGGVVFGTHAPAEEAMPRSSAFLPGAALEGPSAPGEEPSDCAAQAPPCAERSSVCTLDGKSRVEAVVGLVSNAKRSGASWRSSLQEQNLGKQVKYAPAAPLPCMPQQCLCLRQRHSRCTVACASNMRMPCAACMPRRCERRMHWLHAHTYRKGALWGADHLRHSWSRPSGS